MFLCFTWLLLCFLRLPQPRLGRRKGPFRGAGVLRVGIGGPLRICQRGLICDLWLLVERTARAGVDWLQINPKTVSTQKLEGWVGTGKRQNPLPERRKVARRQSQARATCRTNQQGVTAQSSYLYLPACKDDNFNPQRWISRWQICPWKYMKTTSWRPQVVWLMFPHPSNKQAL